MTARRAPVARDLPPELQVAATNGSIVTDSRGKKYIDFVMGWCVGNFGWRPAAIATAVERFKGPDYVYPGHAYAPWTDLARLLVSLAPRGLTTCFRATGGSEAVDLALQHRFFPFPTDQFKRTDAFANNQGGGRLFGGNPGDKLSAHST